MSKLANSTDVLRWGFFGFGIFLIVRADLVVNSVLAMRPFLELLLPNNPRGQNILIAVAMIFALQAGLLCLAAAWGLKRERKWARWVGLLACVALLPGSPWFSLAGLAGIGALLAMPHKLGTVGRAQPTPRPATEDYWARARNSKLQRVFLLLSGALLIAGLNGAIWLATREGLPEYSLGWQWWLYLIPLALLNTTVHECGHAFVAWVLHHQIRVISVGPFTWSRTPYGRSFQIQWKRLLETSGYMGSLPKFRQHERSQQIAVVAAGPISSAVFGIFMLALFLGLPGTRWQEHWYLIATCGVIAFDYLFISLVPVGYSDGSMLFHLIMWTHPGKLLLDASLLAQMDEDAEAYQQNADFIKNVELRELMLRKAQEMGTGNSLRIAICQQKLGYAKLLCEDWPGAERELRKCVDYEFECADNKRLGVNAWTLLHAACVERHEIDQAQLLFPRVLVLLRQRRQENQSVHRAVTHTMLAQLHERSGDFSEALSEARKGLRILAKHRERLALRAMLHAVEARCQVCLGEIEAGLTAGRAAASIVRSTDFPSRERNLAINRIAELGDKMWRAGQPALGIELLREAIEFLDAANATHAAARQRIKLATIFRQLNRQDEARKLLPKEDDLSVVLRRYLLSERASLSLYEQCPENAIADCLLLIELWQAEPGADAEIAIAESLLAGVYLEQGRDVEAEALASKAIAVLDPWKHYEAVQCRITVALAHARLSGEWTTDCVEKSVKQIQADPLLRKTEKVRILETEATRLLRHGRSPDADALRTSAQEYGKHLESLPELAAAGPD